jgi:hypothetical protein
MGHALPTQTPAVVLRSQFNRLRALLAIALIAIGGLTVAVVSLASDSDEVARTSAAKPVESINYGGSTYVNPSTGYSSVGLRPEMPSAGYDGGPVSRYEAEAEHFIVRPNGSK